MGAPAGNQNAAKAKQWSAAIEREVARLADPTIDPDKPIERSPYMKGLDMLAQKFVAATYGSDIAYFKEFGDRIDGKAQQSVALGNEDGSPLFSKVERVIIDRVAPVPPSDGSQD